MIKTIKQKHFIIYAGFMLQKVINFKKKTNKREWLYQTIYSLIKPFWYNLVWLKNQRGGI